MRIIIESLGYSNQLHLARSPTFLWSHRFRGFPLPGRANQDLKNSSYSRRIQSRLQECTWKRWFPLAVHSLNRWFQVQVWVVMGVRFRITRSVIVLSRGYFWCHVVLVDANCIYLCTYLLHNLPLTRLPCFRIFPNRIIQIVLVTSSDDNCWLVVPTFKNRECLVIQIVLIRCKKHNRPSFIWSIEAQGLEFPFAVREFCSVVCHGLPTICS